VVQRTEESDEERYAYYRRCQTFRSNGERCKAPAMKGERLCYKHEQQAQAQRRRQSFTLPPLVDLKSVQGAIRDVAQAIIEGRIDDDYAGALLNRIQNASLMFGGGKR
jgi:hypothetical protein